MVHAPEASRFDRDATAGIKRSGCGSRARLAIGVSATAVQTCPAAVLPTRRLGLAGGGTPAFARGHPRVRAKALAMHQLGDQRGARGVRLASLALSLHALGVVSRRRDAR